MNASADFDRTLYVDCLDAVPALRDVKGTPRAQLMKFVRDETYRQINDGVRNKREITRAVRRATKEKYGSVIMVAILMAVVSFIVRKILERIWPS